jgi:2-iminobutanoate/2-iminopropanoate deaminase
VGAGGVAPLVFLSESGPHALARVRAALTGRGLRLDDLLRLRVFAADRSEAIEIERQLGQMLPRHRWPAVTIVELPSAAGSARAVDAIAAAHAHEQRAAIGGEEAPGTVSGPAAVRFGPWIFVGSLTGASPRELQLGERIEHEARQLFARMERLLRVAGAELRDVVKVGGWLTFPMGEYAPLGRVREELLDRCGLLPASSAVQVQLARQQDQEPLLAFEAIAFAPEGQPRRYPPRARASPLAPYYATARCAGGYVFTCGEIPSAPAPLAEQVGDVYEQLRHHLAEQGATLRDVIHQTVFVRRSEDIRVVDRAMRALLDLTVPPTTALSAADMGFRTGTDVEIELVAQTPRAVAQAPRASGTGLRAVGQACVQVGQAPWAVRQEW